MMFSYLESTLSFPRIGRSEGSRMHEGNLSDAVDHLTISTMSIVGKVQSKYSCVFVAYTLLSFVMVVECNVMCFVNSVRRRFPKEKYCFTICYV